MQQERTDYRAHTIFATATNSKDASWVASFSAWPSPLGSPAAASIRGSIVGNFLSRDQAILAVVNEGMRRLDVLLGPVTSGPDERLQHPAFRDVSLQR